MPSTEIRISIKPETDDPRKHYDGERLARILHNQQHYGEWGWCRVFIRALYRDFTVETCLEGYSCQSEEDFKRSNWYADLLDHLEYQLDQMRHPDDYTDSDNLSFYS